MIGFVIARKYECFFLKNVLKNLPKASYRVLLCNQGWWSKYIRREFWPSLNEIKNILCEDNGSILMLDEARKDIEKYKILVCFHASFLVSSLHKDIRKRMHNNAPKLYFFSFSVFEHSFEAHYIKHFDKVLCSGKVSKEHIESLHTKATVLDLGSPKLDKKFDQTINIPCLKLIRRLNPRKRTILFCAIHDQPYTVLSNLLKFFQKFSIDFNIVLSYLANTARSVADKKKALNIYSPDAIDAGTDLDNSELMVLSDFVFCDGGGSLFTAVGMDKNVVFIKKHVKYDRYRTVNLYNEAYDKLGTFSTDDYDKIAATLKDDAYWERQRVVRAELRKQFFSFHKEPSGKLIADELMRDLKAASECNVKA